jgi:myosin heavy subunit
LDLNALILRTSCLYVRCINPNEDLNPEYFDNDFVSRQMSAMKIVESARVFKAGFSVRITFEQLRKSLGNSAEESELRARVEELFDGEREEVLIACILTAHSVPADAYKLGKSIVFFRQDLLELLDKVVEGPGSSSKAQTQFCRLLNDLLERAREAYEVSDRVDNESEDLLHAIETVEEAAQTMSKRFEDVKANPKSLPGRLAALSTLVKTQTQILDKVNRMYKTASESSEACRDAANHCDPDEARRDAAIVGELFDQIIHQIKGVISSVEKANHSLAMIENDIREVEDLEEVSRNKAKQQLSFKLDQTASVGEALLEAERRKSHAAELRLRAVEDALNARRAAEAKTAELIAETERHRIEAERQLAAEKQQAAARLKAARRSSEKRDWAHAEERIDLERRMSALEKEHEKQRSEWRR